MSVSECKGPVVCARAEAGQGRMAGKNGCGLQNQVTGYLFYLVLFITYLARLSHLVALHRAVRQGTSIQNKIK